MGNKKENRYSSLYSINKESFLPAKAEDNSYSKAFYSIFVDLADNKNNKPVPFLRQAF